MASEKNKDITYVYSKICGANLYVLCGVSEDCYVVEDSRSSVPRRYLASIVYRTSEEDVQDRTSWFADIVLNPVQDPALEWPIDLVEIEHDGVVDGCLVYKVRDYAEWSPFRSVLYQQSMSEVLDWRNPAIFALCKNMLVAFEKMHRKGYLYNHFQMDSMLYHPTTCEIFLKFHPYVRKNGSDTDYDIVPSDYIAKEFAPPYVYREEYRGYLSETANDYQITALLFRLMIGRLPYEGSAMLTHGAILDPAFDTDYSAHENYMRHYHQYPHFIFDETDDSNALSATTDQDLPRERWAVLPDDIKEMFRRGLAQTSAETEPTDWDHMPPTPEAWLEALSRLQEQFN